MDTGDEAPDAAARARKLKQQRERALTDLEIIKAHAGEPYQDLTGIAEHAHWADSELD